MASQTVPAAVPTTKIDEANFEFKGQRELFQSILVDLVTLRNSVDALTTAYNTVVTNLNGLANKYNAHTHKADGNQGSTYNTSKAQSDEETIAQQTPSNDALTTAAAATAPSNVATSVT